MTSFDLPEPLLKVIHIQLIAAQALARAAAEQPKEMKGKEPKTLMAMACQRAEDIFNALPEDKQHKALVKTAAKLAYQSGAMAMSVITVETKD